MKKKPVKKQMTATFGMRIDPNKLEDAKRLEIDMPALFRHTLEQELLRRTRKCPTCGASKLN